MSVMSRAEHRRLDAAVAEARACMQSWPHGRWTVGDCYAPSGMSQRGIVVYVESAAKHLCLNHIAAQLPWRGYPVVIRGFDEDRLQFLETPIQRMTS